MEEDKIEGKTFMFTGTLSITRDEARRVVEELGGIPGSSVNRQTDYLVCGADQVGKSSKWEKAGLLGVTRVDEDFFWELVKRAKTKSTEDSEVLVHLEEGEEPTEEQWEIIAQVDGLKIMTEEQFVRLLKRLSPSYENPDKLKELVDKYQLELLPPTVCKFCGEVVPYSIHTKASYSTPYDGWYFCFNCRQQSFQEEHNHSWFDPKIPGAKEGLLMCRLCGDFIEMDYISYKECLECDEQERFWHSAEHLVEVIEESKRLKQIEEEAKKLVDTLHFCTDFEEVPELPGSESGVYVRCKVCKKVEFVDLAKFGGNEET